MGLTFLKIIGASQSLIHKCENLKRKLYKCNASIYFNRQCLENRLTPSYARVGIPNTSPAHKYTQKKVTVIDYLQHIYNFYTHNGDDIP